MVYVFSMGPKSGLWQDHFKTLILAGFSYSFNTFDVYFRSLSCWKTQLYLRPNLLLMILGLR